MTTKVYFKIQNWNEGITTLECLVSISLLGLMFVLALPTEKFIISTFLTVQGNEEVSLRSSHVLSSCGRALKRSEALYAIPAYLVHPRGGILFYQHQGLRSDRRFLRYPPDPKSNALTTLELGQELPLRVIDRHGSHVFTLCLQDGSQSEDLPGFRHWIALGIDGVTWVAGDVNELHSTDEKCQNGVTYRGQFLEHPFAAILALMRDQGISNFPDVGQVEVLSNMQLLFPLLDAYTLYVDQQKVFRRISHLTNENQPVAYEVEQLSIQTQKQLAQQSLIQIDVSILHPRTRAPTSKHYFLTIGSLESNHFADLIL